jgi:hypothetical protein
MFELSTVSRYFVVRDYVYLGFCRIIGKSITSLSKFENNKKGRGTGILHGDMTFSKKLPRVSNGFEISCGE